MPFWTRGIKSNWLYKPTENLSAEQVFIRQLLFKRAHSTAGVQREECMILFLSKRSLSFSEFTFLLLLLFSLSLCVSLSVSLLRCQSNSCFSFGQPPNGWLRRVNGFLISLVNAAFSLLSLPRPAVPTPRHPDRRKTWSGRRGNKQPLENNARAGSEHQTFKLRGHWLGMSWDIWRVSFPFLSSFVG